MNESVEEVPLDLFDKVSVEEETSQEIEMVDLSTPKKSVDVQSDDSEASKGAIRIPADAYMAALQKANNSNNS